MDSDVLYISEIQIGEGGVLVATDEDGGEHRYYPFDASGNPATQWIVTQGTNDGYAPLRLAGYAPPKREPLTELTQDTVLQADIEGYVTIDGNITLDLNGHTINGGGAYTTLIINSADEDTGYTLTLKGTVGGGKITGGNSESGGGIQVSNHSTLIMQGGEISGNSATYGGGVVLGLGASFDMRGGAFTGNTARYGGSGGGVHNSGDFTMSLGWSYEGVGWYSDDAEGVPLYRQFNPNVDPSASYNNSGSHNYTTSKDENDHLVSLGWRAEGIGWYGLANASSGNAKLAAGTAAL